MADEGKQKRMNADPFETGDARREVREKRDLAAARGVKETDVAALRAVMKDLPPTEYGSHYIDIAARKICFALEWAKLEIQESPEHLTERTSPSDRQPLARAVTDETAWWYWDLTERTPTRISKPVDWRLGLQETGPFAQFLGKVFSALNIRASAASQVKLWKRRWENSPDHPRHMIHPREFAEILYDEGIPAKDRVDQLFKLNEQRKKPD